MGKLVPAERREIERKLHDPGWRARLVRVQEIVQKEFEKFRDQAETLIIRAIVPRTTIKEVTSVTAKIEANRENHSTYSLNDVEDLVGIKILCPYPTDVKEVIRLMRKQDGFEVKPDSDSAARREKAEGYRGYHFTIQLKYPLIVNNEDLMGIKCEVQVKTMTEEAWDAKTHDVTYKPKRYIDPDLQRAMRLVSDELKVLDDWSESLRDLILHREREERKRKEAVAAVYLYDSQTLFQELLSKIPLTSEIEKEIQELREEKFNHENVRHLLPVIQQYRQEGKLTESLCRMSGLVALHRRGLQIDIWALDVCDDLIRQKLDLPRPYLTKGAVCWALDRLDDALEVTDKGIENATEQNDLEAVADGKGNFAYWVAEKAWVGTAEPDLVCRAKEYIEHAIKYHPDWLGWVDTKGFLLVATGETVETVWEGRRLIQESRQKLIGTDIEKLSAVFFDRHERTALIKLSVFENVKAP